MTTPVQTEPILSISVVSYNTRQLVDDCLRSIADHTRVPHEVLLVDNASRDATVEMARAKYPGAYVIANSENRGFAIANNQALEHARGKYFLLLNSDTVVRPGALDKLVEFMERHPEAAAVGSKLIYADGSTQRSVRRFPSVSGAAFTMTYVDRVFPRAPLIGSYMMGDFDYEREAEVDQPMGACLLLRMETIKQIGALDERFFMYFEEVDWCLRAKQAGWKIYYHPASVVVHLENQSSIPELSRTIVYFHESMVKYYRKHFGEREAQAIKAIAATGLSMRLAVAGFKAATGKIDQREFRQRAQGIFNVARKLPGM